ncbi:MAG: tRNA lysidine(34) synthetase TilS [Oscillospiraceae bacterium]
MSCSHIVIENIRLAAERFDMFGGTDTIVSALSGGADSVCLTLALKELSSEYGFKLKAVHVNHLLRGAESDRDEQFCRELCEKEAIPLTVFRADAAAFAKEQKMSLESGARKLRYGFFDEVCKDKTRIATAHTLSDSAETVIFNLCRGTGLKGLCGIPPVRDNMIRPLIYCKREEILSFLSEKGQEFVTDSTNLSDDYSRNKIRHNVIPVLEELNSGFFESVKRLTESLSEDERFLSELAKEHYDDDLRSVDASVRRRVIKQKLRENGIEPSGEKILSVEDCALKGNGKTVLSGELYAVAKNGRIRTEIIPRERMIFPEKSVIIGENPFLCDKTVIISVNNGEKSADTAFVNDLLTKCVLDCDKIQGELILRNRRDGDSFIRAGRSFTSSLKKLMNESIPVGERDKIAVLADEKGIIWVEGFGIAERVKPDAFTKRYMKINVKEK